MNIVYFRLVQVMLTSVLKKYQCLEEKRFQVNIQNYNNYLDIFTVEALEMSRGSGVHALARKLVFRE